MNKLLIFVFVLIALVAAQEESSENWPWGHKKFEWSRCSAQMGQVDSINVSPNPPKKGHDVSVSVKYTLKETVTSGKIDIVAKVLGITVAHNKYDLCSMVKKVGESCPLAAGTHSLSLTHNIPKATPSGSATAHATITDQSGRSVVCADAKASL